MTGDYFAFIDSDDFVDETMYEKLCEKAKLEQADMVFCNFNIVENGTDIKPYDEEKLKDTINNFN